VDNGLGVRLLLAVARLGEADLFGWWNSRGFSEAGRYLLGRSFPRTWSVNALQLAVVSAAARHEEELKRPSAVHLFSDQLPFKRLVGQWLVEPGYEVIGTLRLLVNDARAFREACYYEAARADSLLGAFAAEALFAWHQAGRSEVTVADSVAWLVADGRTPAWTPPTRTRVGQGLLSALRDFGILEGAVRKRIAPPRLSMRGFAYVALREQRSRAKSLRSSWREVVRVSKRAWVESGS
jgi:hypothetical protein